MKNKELYRYYTGQQILEIPPDAYVPLVNNILYKNDLSILVGPSKTNKSIFAMQLACSISSGTPFLNTFDVPEPRHVWYFSTEGKDNDIKDRFLRMSRIIPTNFKNISLICSTQLKFNTMSGMASTDKILKEYGHTKPAVIFVDSVYSGFQGTLISDEQVNTFITRLRYLMEECDNAACKMVHHFNKEQKDSEGKKIAQNASNAYGSVFLIAQCDQCLTIDKCTKDTNDRIVKCDEQRSGKIVDNFRVRFHEPDPLYLNLKSNHAEEEAKVIKLLLQYKEGLTTNAIIQKAKIKSSLAYIVIGEMKATKKIGNPEGYGGRHVLLGGTP